MKQYSRTKVRSPSSHDLVDQKILAACEKAAVDALRPILAENKDRYLRTLQPHELRAMTVAVMSAYINTRSCVELREDLNDDISDVGQA